MNKTFVYIGIIVIVLLLALGSFGHFGFSRKTGNVVKENKNENIDLTKYRSEKIPEECRLPDYENDLNWWKEHLSHHSNTLFCLDYFK